MIRKRSTIGFRLFAAAVFVLLLSAYTMADNRSKSTELRQLAGTVSYRERMALPPGSNVTVTLVEVSSEEYLIIAEEIIEPSGQVPIPFALEYEPDAIQPERDYAIRAVIKSPDGETLWTTVEPFPITDFDNAQEMEILLSKEGSKQQISMLPGHIFQADDTQFTAYFGDGRVHLILPDSGMVILPEVQAASGAKYTDGSTTFWNKGDEAFIEVGGDRYQTYLIEESLTPWEKARRTGIDFRALGQEPGWVLEIRENETLAFTGDYGTLKIVAPVSEVEVDPQTGSKIYSAQTEVVDLRAVVQETPYNDTMSGEAFPTTVTVYVGDQVYQGGGHQLQ